MLIWVGTITLVMVFLVLSGIQPTLVDDTFITFQYARNLSELHLLTWHPDVAMVDGFTSLGHVLLLAAGIASGMDIVLVNSLIVFGAMALILLIYLRKTSDKPDIPRLLGLSVITLHSGFLIWVAAGLDGVPYAASFFLAYQLFEKAEASGRMSPAVVFALLILAVMRPEGMLITLVLLAFFWATRLFGRPLELRSALLGSAGILLVIGGMLFWRWATYGYVMPNTYYAKSSASQVLEIKAGMTYVVNWLLAFGGVIAIVPLMALILGAGNWLRVLIILGQIAVVILEGGDSHPGYRFLLPIVPLIALDVAWLTAQPRFKSIVTRSSIVGLYAILHLFHSFGDAGVMGGIRQSIYRIASGEWPYRAVADDETSSQNIAASRLLGASIVAGTKVAATDVGKLAYFSRLPILDAYGLNHPELAHLAKPEGVLNSWGLLRLDVLAEQGAPVILTWFPQFQPDSWKQIGDGERLCPGDLRQSVLLLASAQSQIIDRYECVSIPSAAEEGSWLNVLIRNGQSSDVLINPAAAEISHCLPDILTVCGQ